MANQEQVMLLKQGCWVWNEWRRKYRGIQIDLSGADLRNADLSGANLNYIDLGGADLRNADLWDANLSDADLSDANLSDANLNSADLIDTNLSNAELWSANLSNANLWSANLSGANLSSSKLNSTNFSKANLSDADLSRADLSNADLSRTNLSSANLSGARFIDANLSNADLNGADLNGTDFSGALLRGTNFYLTRMHRTLLTNLDLREADKLETIEHQGPSSIGTDTILKSEGNIPDVFLRGVGLSDTFIEYVHTLAQKPLEYYTCSISYSSKDQGFAERLYADLQSHGVRCWLSPEDREFSGRIRTRFAESSRGYDKLLLVLSQHAMKNPWVATAVKAALEKEQRRGCLTLFPVMLDETMMETDQVWAIDIRQTRFMGDFIRWKEENVYQFSFQQLLHDLNVSLAIKHT